MAVAAATELARSAEVRGIEPQQILPRMDEWEVAARVAVATATAAQAQGLTSSTASASELHERATRTIRAARETTRVLMKEGLIPQPPAAP